MGRLFLLSFPNNVENNRDKLEKTSTQIEIDLFIYFTNTSFFTFFVVAYQHFYFTRNSQTNSTSISRKWKVDKMLGVSTNFDSTILVISKNIMHIGSLDLIYRPSIVYRNIIWSTWPRSLSITFFDSYLSILVSSLKDQYSNIIHPSPYLIRSWSLLFRSEFNLIIWLENIRLFTSIIIIKNTNGFF